MISALVCAGDSAQRRRLSVEMKEIAAKLSEEEWVVFSCSSPGDSEAFLKSRSLLEVLICDVSTPAFLDWLPTFRKEHNETQILLVAERGLSPQRYLRPQISAASLLLKPWKEQALREVMSDFVRSVLDDRQGERGCLSVKTSDGLLRIPFEKIYYLEAREKRIFVRLQREEWGFYGSLEKLEATLPETFVRTHRSFLVNYEMIEKVLLDGASVQLRDGFQVPLARSCRGRLKELTR